MGELVNLLLGAVSPGTPAPADPQAASSSKHAEVAGGGFQELMLKSLEGNPNRVEAGESWAGQQVTEETKPGETESEDKSEKSTAGTEILLGSTETTPSLPEAADAATALVVPPPQLVEVQTPVVDEAEVMAPSAPDPRSTVQAAVATQSETGIGIPTSQAASTASETVTASKPSASETEISVAQSAVPAAPAEAQMSEAELVVPATSPQVLTEAAEPVVSDAPAHAEKKPHAGVPSHKQSPPIGRTVERLGAELPAAAGAWKPSLPEVQAPVQEKGAGEYQLPATRLVLASEGNGSAKPEMRFADGKAPNAHPRLDPTDTTGLTQAQERASAGRPVYVPQEINDLLPPPVEVAPVERPTTDRTADAQSRTESDTSWLIADIRASDLKVVSNAERSPGYNAPDRVVEQKLIHEVVRAAKMQFTDGGASMAIRLNPPHLGLLQMSVSAEQGTVTASLHTSTEAARNALQADLSLLKQALSDAGINVDSINVSLGAGAEYERMLHSGAHGGPANSDAHGNPRFTEGLLSPESEPAISNARLQPIGGFDYLA